MPDQAPLRLDGQCAARYRRVRLGAGRDLGTRRRSAGTRRADRRSALSSVGGARSTTALGGPAARSRSRNGPASAASRSRGPLLHDAAPLEHRDLLGPRGRGEPVGDQDAGAAGEQAVGGAHHAGLGDRVHPRGRLVEHDDADVAHQQPGEGDQLLLAGRERGAARAEQGVEAVAAGRRPSRSGRARRRPPRRRRAGASAEQRDVLGQGAGQDLGALGDHADRRAQLLEVEVEHVGAAEEHGARLRLRRPATAATRASTCRSRCGRPGRRSWPAGTSRSTSRSANVPSRVGEVQVAELDVERPVGQRPPAGRLGPAPPACRAAGSPRRSRPAGRAGAGPAWSIWPTNVVVTRNSVTSGGGRRGRRRRPARRRRPRCRPARRAAARRRAG